MQIGRERSNDGLERAFRFFNWLKGGVCTTCAPGDQGKANGGQREQRFKCSLVSAPAAKVFGWFESRYPNSKKWFWNGRLWRKLDLEERAWLVQG